jgi:predicted secreted Zn-dependent protease
MLGAAMAVAGVAVQSAPIPPSSHSFDAGFAVIRRDNTVMIEAASHRELSRALSDLRRTRGWHGQTALSFEQKAEFVSDASGCRMTDLRTTLAVTVTLPRLDLRDGRHPRHLERLWQASLAALRAHEEGHVAIGVEGAKDSHDRLSALGPFARCREARRALMREELRFRHRQALLHERYDRRTDFGLRPSPVTRGP